MSIISVSCGDGNNPLLRDFNTPFGLPPFGDIRNEHYIPAFEAAIKESRREVETIISNPDAPTFENTIVALERSGKLLGRISGVFFNLNECLTDSVMQGIALEVSPMLTELGNDILLDPALFARVKAVHNARETLSLPGEDSMLLENTYKGFVRSGANLSDGDKEEYRKISTELSELTLKFGQNVLGATNAYSLNITDSADLAGLPPMVVDGAREEALSRGSEGWIFTLQAPSMLPFMQYSTRRGLRETLWMAYNTRCIGGEFDNTSLVRRIANLRLREANLLGYPTYADFVLEERMAGSSGAVNAFLGNLASRAMPYAVKDYDMISAYAASLGLKGKLMPWDWAFYSEKYKEEHFNLNDEITRPYFKLENVEKGVFLLANKLYGIEFRENDSLPRYHPDVRCFEVFDNDGSFLSILYIDYFPRESKSGGAWMTSFREQSRTGDIDTRPVVSLVCNFTKPTPNNPSLLTFREAETILHEFGHALHGMLSAGTYESLTGTSVRRDFVELPSQIMENWMTEKEYLDLWAVHYQTGEKIPSSLVENIVAADNFLSGYANSRQLGFAIMDMAWHSITAPVGDDDAAIEKSAMDKVRVIPFIDGTAFSPSFSHIFGGGYAAGYYGYKWAEVLDADAFQYFKENGIFNRDIALKFRDNILSKGGSEPPMKLYVRFRGQEPSADAFFERAGLK